MVRPESCPSYQTGTDHILLMARRGSARHKGVATRTATPGPGNPIGGDCAFRMHLLTTLLLRAHSAPWLCPPQGTALPHPRNGQGWADFQCEGGAGGGGSRARKHREAGCGRPEDGGVGTTKTVKRPRQQPAQPPIRQLLGAADAQTAHHATSSTAPAHQLLGSANAETTPARALAAAADRKQQPDATCEGKNG